VPVDYQTQQSRRKELPTYQGANDSILLTMPPDHASGACRHALRTICGDGVIGFAAKKRNQRLQHRVASERLATQHEGPGGTAGKMRAQPHLAATFELRTKQWCAAQRHARAANCGTDYRREAAIAHDV
jgi:hypothetical protein